MRRIREVLGRGHECGLSHRQVSASTGMSKGSVSEYLRRAAEAGVTWELARELDDRELEAKLFVNVGQNLPQQRAPIDHAWVHTELQKRGVTLQLVWTEYCGAAAKDEAGLRPYQYSQFCELHTRWTDKLDVVMRRVHRAGEKLFVDYAGMKPRIWDRETGEAIEVELFVAVLGASNYTYAEATRTQRLTDFVGSTIRALEYFGAVPQVLVPDQLRAAVSGPDRYDPEINPTYAEMAAHYGMAVVPARAGEPRDKAKVETAVQIAERWILACLRNRRFFSLDELNDAIAELLERLNTRPFQKLAGCRRSRFEELERAAMRPLPARRYELALWKRAGVGIDYHVEYEGRYYSVPHPLIRAKVELRVTAQAVEILHRRKRVASHARSYGPKGTAVTDPSHRPRSHREYGDWPPERVIGWAETLGPNVAALVRRILADKPHPEQGYRSCLALFRDIKRFDRARVDAACARALEIGAPRRQTVVALLSRGLERQPVVAPPSRPPIPHEHVRGGDYYDRKEMQSDDHHEPT